MRISPDLRTISRWTNGSGMRAPACAPRPISTADCDLRSSRSFDHLLTTMRLQSRSSQIFDRSPAISPRFQSPTFENILDLGTQHSSARAHGPAGSPKRARWRTDDCARTPTGRTQRSAVSTRARAPRAAGFEPSRAPVLEEDVGARKQLPARPPRHVGVAGSKDASSRRSAGAAQARSAWRHAYLERAAVGRPRLDQAHARLHAHTRGKRARDA